VEERSNDMNTLGESARVTVSQASLDAYKGPMPQAKKREMRREAIIAYVKRRTFGSRIKIEEFQQVGAFKTAANADAFIKNMLRDKVLMRENITPRTYWYSVPNEVVTITKAADPRRKKLTFTEVEQIAIQWSWENPDCYNDLHKFIEHIMKEQPHGRTEEKPEPVTNA
jgi:hypothetical protein